MLTSETVVQVYLSSYMKIQVYLHYTNPKSRGIPSSACSGTSNLENPVQKAESLRCLALRGRGGKESRYMYVKGLLDCRTMLGGGSGR